MSNQNGHQRPRVFKTGQSQEAELRRSAVSCSCFASLSPLHFPPFSGSSTSKTTALKLNLNLFLAEKTAGSASRAHSHVTRSAFLPHWSRRPPTSSEEVQPIPGLQTRAEGGKEVAGNRDGERRGCWRAWRTGRTGAAVWLCLFQPRLHVSKQADHERMSLGKTHPAGFSP